ncbi:MAG: type II secretion system protein GspG [Planctomycetes bacterium]|nr:type II secretion system protein GspG [Planctomycetota bacterium]
MSALLILLFVQDGNLVQNPGFEDGRKDPAHWDRCDGLTTFWEKDPLRPGKCIRVFSRIHIDDYHKRLEEMKLENPPPPSKPREIKGKGYDTVGGLDGVGYWSDWIDLKAGMRYTLTADVRSEGGKPKIFVKGYSELPVEIDDNGKAKKVLMRRVTFKIYLDCDGGDKWKTSTVTFCPTHDREDVKWARVMLYGYWPAQNYWFDNIRIVEAGKDPEAPKRWAALKEKAEQQQRSEREAQVKEARYCLAYVRKGIERYKADVGSLPPGLRALVEDPGDPKWCGPYVLELGDDPWGKPYQYKQTSAGYALKSLGPDGAEGGGDDVE